MSKFSNTPPKLPRQVAQGPIRTTGTRIPTHEGGAGFERTPESELFLLAATNMVGEDTFYESAAVRDGRFAHLVDHVTKTNPQWIQGFVPYLRNTLQMRSASIVLAAEYVKAGGPNGRAVVNSAMSRADEPAEMLGYWMSRYGRKLPAAVKRGIADAASRLYTERAALRYDGLSRGIRMADVIELVHPKPRMTHEGGGPWQTALFRYLLDKRHHPEGTNPPPLLKRIVEDEALRAAPEDTRRALLKAGAVAEAGWSWERLSGWLPGGMDAEAWEHIIPQMGYMAKLRNLRNFDDAGVSDEVKDAIRAELADPEAVAKSRQFPFRFFSAYKFAPSVEWAKTLETALELSCQNIPELSGRSLILIDISGSMQAPMSNRGQVMRYEVGALFAAATAKKCEKVDVGLFANEPIAHPVKGSVLRYVESVNQKIGVVGYGTNIHGSLAQMYNGHDRVIIFSDEAAHDCYQQAVQAQIPVLHVFNLGGYRTATIPSGPGRYSYGGFTDATFVLMSLLEQGDNAVWPWMTEVA
jgi:hypothetical protein